MLVAQSAGSGGDGPVIEPSSAGAGGEREEYIPPHCVYLPDTAADPGCDTLVANAGFADGVEAWDAQHLKIIVGWDPRDATEAEGSGSLGVNNTLFGEAVGETMGGVWQCLPVTSGGVYDFVADVFIPSGQDPGRAGINVYYYDSADCEGGTDDSVTSELVEATDTWLPIHLSHTVPPRMRSMFVHLVAVKPFDPLSFRALFDNVLVRLR